MQTVYLAGPITGSSYGQATEWRDYAKDLLESSGEYKCLTPMRGKEALKHIERFEPNGYDGVASNHNICHRDEYDVHRSDVLLVNLAGATRVSIGTMMEIAWGHHAGKFVITVLDSADNPHNHAFVIENSSMVVTSLDAAIEYLLKVLNA